MWTFARIVWLNTVFCILALIVSILFAVGGTVWILSYRFISGNRRKTLWQLRRTISHYGDAILKCAWPLVRVKYVDQAPEEKPPFVFVCNHRSSSDAYLMAVLPFECIQVVNIWPFKIPWLGIVAKIAGYLSVREMPIESFVSSGTQLLNEGTCVITFPEGTRSGSRLMGPFNSSPFRLAQNAGAKIAPLAISGNENIPRRGSLLLRPGIITVYKLPAVKSDDYRDISVFKLKTLVHERIQKHLDLVEVAPT